MFYFSLCLHYFFLFFFASSFYQSTSECPKLPTVVVSFFFAVFSLEKALSTPKSMQFASRLNSLNPMCLIAIQKWTLEFLISGQSHISFQGRSTILFYLELATLWFKIASFSLFFWLQKSWDPLESALWLMNRQLSSFVSSLGTSSLTALKKKVDWVLHLDHVSTMIPNVSLEPRINLVNNGDSIPKLSLRATGPSLLRRVESKGFLSFAFFLALNPRFFQKLEFLQLISQLKTMSPQLKMKKTSSQALISSIFHQ